MHMVPAQIVHGEAGSTHHRGAHIFTLFKVNMGYLKGGYLGYLHLPTSLTKVHAHTKTD